MIRAVRAQLAWWVLFGIVFGVCFAGTSWWSTLHPLPVVPHFSWETATPFVPWAAWVYLSIIPAMALMAWLGADDTAVPRWIGVMGLQTMFASLAFAVFPMQTAFDLDHLKTQPTLAYQLADLLNFTNNQVPSLHVAFAVTIALALGWQRHIAARWAASVWVVAVCVSTLVIREHHVLDIVMGIALGICGLPLYRFLSRPSIWDPIHADMVSIQQFSRFIRRHRRYAWIFLGIYGPSLFRWRRYRALRWGFVTLQWIDDILDGDRPCPEEPLIWVNKVVNEYATTMPRSDPAKLLGLTIQHLQQTNPTVDPQELVLSLIDVMKRDRKRVIEKRVWSQSHLLQHHRATFQKSIDLMLAAAGCQGRASQVSHLVEAFGWSSTFRDLEEDFNKGLFNVPAHVWHAVDHEQHSLESLTNTREFRVWANTYLKTTRTHLDAAKTQLRALDIQSRRILAVFQRSIERMTQRLPKQKPQWFDVPHVIDPHTAMSTERTTVADSIQDPEVLCSE